MPLSPWGESCFFLMIHAVGDCPGLPKPWVNSADMAIEAVGAYIQTSDLSSHASFYQCRWTILQSARLSTEQVHEFFACLGLVEGTGEVAGRCDGIPLFHASHLHAHVFRFYNNHYA